MVRKDEYCECGSKKRYAPQFRGLSRHECAQFAVVQEKELLPSVRQGRPIQIYEHIDQDI